MDEKVLMAKNAMLRTAGRSVAAGAAVAAVGYVALAARAWIRFGCSPRSGSPEERDPLLDRFIPMYDIVERHHIAVNAPASVTMACARTIGTTDACLSRAIFRARELVLRADRMPPPRGGLVASLREIGWGVLTEEPSGELVLGAVTRPWEPNPVFRSVPASAFAAFAEPGVVKIAFTLRADAVGPGASTFRTETRAVATDADARRLFRRYWAMVSPGVALIRVALLKPIKRAAERQTRVAATDLAIRS
jgi:hypothetical protein